MPPVALRLAYAGLPGLGWEKGEPPWPLLPGQASPGLAAVPLPPLLALAGEKWLQCGPWGRWDWKEGPVEGEISEVCPGKCVCALCA